LHLFDGFGNGDLFQMGDNEHSDFPHLYRDNPSTSF